MSLLDQLAGSLDASTIAKLGQQIGADSSTTQSALEAALPALLGGLANNASKPGGASALNAALERDHDGSILDNVGSLLGGASGGGGAAGALASMFGGGESAGLGGLLGMAAQAMTDAPGNGGAKTVDGAGILGHILGGKRDAVENGVAQGSGLDKAQIAKLLVLAAPLVMGALGKAKQSQGLDADGVSTMVKQESERAGGGLLGGLLDGGDDNGIAGELAQMAGKKLLSGLFS